MENKKVIWFDIDNCLYGRSSRISEMMQEKISLYFLHIGIPQDEADKLHKEYYTKYGLAIRGLVEHHKIDPLDYDKKCDGSLELEKAISKDENLRSLLSSINRSKFRVWALTNAYKTHAERVLNILGVRDQFEGIVYCDYTRHKFPCKPEKEFYFEAMEKVGLRNSPSYHYFVDDSSQNVISAQEIGWNAVYYLESNQENVKGQDDEKKRRNLHSNVKPIIGNLYELKEVWRECFNE